MAKEVRGKLERVRDKLSTVDRSAAGTLGTDNPDGIPFFAEC
jgi:hypothetical protein